ncbi:hypothetical protein [uncultured Muribaculum sp.]|nr:hypothetical protein [uncultured Muribaculum sp.]
MHVFNPDEALRFLRLSTSGYAGVRVYIPRRGYMWKYFMSD